jgi:hypothetical protein
MISTESVFDFAERRYASEVDLARFFLDSSRRFEGKENYLHNARMHREDAKNIRNRINVMRGNA